MEKGRRKEKRKRRTEDVEVLDGRKEIKKKRIRKERGVAEANGDTRVSMDAGKYNYTSLPTSPPLFLSLSIYVCLRRQLYILIYMDINI